MADEKVRYVLDVDDKGTPKIVKFGDAAKKAGETSATAFEKFGKGLESAASKIPGLTSSLDMAKSAAKALSNPLVAIPAALVGGALAASKFASSNAELVTEMSHLGASAGMTVNEMLAFKRIGGPLGIAVESIAGASAKLSLNLSKNGDTLRALGITAKDPVEAMAQVADKFSKSESASYRARLATEAFGKSWKELAPLLQEGGQKIRDAAGGGVLSQGMIDRYKEIHERTIEIGKTWPKIKAAIGDVASGPLNDMLGIMAEIAKYETAWVSDFRKARSVKADISVEQRFTESARKTFSGIGRRGTSNEIDEEKALTEFRKKSAEERRTIMSGYLNNEQSLITKSLATRMQSIINADRKEAEEAERKNKAELDRLENADKIKAAAEKAAADRARARQDEEIAKLNGAAAVRAAIWKREDAEASRMESFWREYYLELDQMRSEDAAKDECDAIEKQMKEANRRAAIWAAEDEKTARMEGYWRDYYLELDQMRIDDAKAQEDATNQLIVSSFQPLQGYLQQMSADMLNGEASMASFQEAFKAMLVNMAAELMANAAIFGFLSLFSGGAATTFAGGLSGLSGLLFRADGGSVSPGQRYIVGERQAETFRATVPGQITNHTTNHTYGAVTVNVSGGGSSVDANAIAQAVVRAQSIQSRKRAGGSF